MNSLQLKFLKQRIVNHEYHKQQPGDSLLVVLPMLVWDQSPSEISVSCNPSSVSLATFPIVWIRHQRNNKRVSDHSLLFTGKRNTTIKMPAGFYWSLYGTGFEPSAWPLGALKARLIRQYVRSVFFYLCCLTSPFAPCYSVSCGFLHEVEMVGNSFVLFSSVSFGGNGVIFWPNKQSKLQGGPKSSRGWCVTWVTGQIQTQHCGWVAGSWVHWATFDIQYIWHLLHVCLP